MGSWGGGLFGDTGLGGGDEWERSAAGGGGKKQVEGEEIEWEVSLTRAVVWEVLLS